MGARFAPEKRPDFIEAGDDDAVISFVKLTITFSSINFLVKKVPFLYRTIFAGWFGAECLDHDRRFVGRGGRIRGRPIRAFRCQQVSQ